MSSSSRVGLLDDGARGARGLLSSCLVIAGLLVEIVECWRCVGDSLVELMLLEVNVERVWFVFTRSTIMRENGREALRATAHPLAHTTHARAIQEGLTRHGTVNELALVDGCVDDLELFVASRGSWRVFST